MLKLRKIIIILSPTATKINQSDTILLVRRKRHIARAEFKPIKVNTFRGVIMVPEPFL